MRVCCQRGVGMNYRSIFKRGIHTNYKCLLLLFMVSILLLSQTVSSFAASKIDKEVTIFLLNSYNDQLEWSNEVMSGINDAMMKYFPNARIRIEYMDTKNISGDEYFEELYKTYHYKYGKEKFDAIISMDDNALKFLLRYRDALFSDVPIFFCGVNLLETHNIETEDHIYGVVEKTSAVDTLAIAVRFNANLKNVYIVGDTSLSGQSTMAAIKEDVEAADLGLNLIFLDQLSLEGVIEKVASINDDTAAILYSFFIVDTNHDSYTVKSTTERVVAASNVPVYGLWSFSYGYGIIGGKLISGYAHGEKAVELAADYFSGKRYEGNQYITSINTNRFMYDYDAMAKFHFDMDKLPADSIVINEPTSFYEENKEIVLLTFALVLFLLLYIVVLMRQIRNRTHALVEQEKKLMEAERLASLGSVVTGVAHELNTPLGNALMLASFLKKENQRIVESVNNNNMAYSDFNKSIHLCGESVDSLIKNLKRTEKIVEAFKRVVVHYSSDDQRVLDIKEYLEKLILLIQNTIQCQISLSCEPNLYFEGSQNSLFRVLDQLIENSIKHGFEDVRQGKIDIEVKGRNAVIIIEYRDNGRGIAKGQEKNIFEPFTTDKRGAGHTGLGLYSTYNLVTSMGGTIKCDVNCKKGAKFIIELPKYNG